MGMRGSVRYIRGDAIVIFNQDSLKIMHKTTDSKYFQSKQFQEYEPNYGFYTVLYLFFAFQCLSIALSTKLRYAAIRLLEIGICRVSEC